MRILLTNDDGIYAPGVNALLPMLRQFGRVSVVAPDRDCSAISQALTVTRPLRVHRLDDERIAVEGTPADCVHMASTGLLDIQPDMVVSGINSGANLGDDVVYSGTVAAAIEGRYLGMPAMAVSLAGQEKANLDYSEAVVIAEQLVKRLIAHPLPKGTVLNVNVPNVPKEQIAGFELTKLGQRHPPSQVLQEIDPRGRKGYWISPAGAAKNDEPGTDFHAIAHNFVSITPLQIDMTHYKLFPKMSPWMDELHA